MRRAARIMTSGAIAIGLVATAVGCASSDDGEQAASPGTTPATSSDGPTEVPARPSPGCAAGAAGTAQREQQHTMEVDGTERWYLLTTPDSDGATPLPLVFDFHGLMEGAAVHATMSQYSDLAESEGFAVVFPNGTGEPLRWNANPLIEDNPDLAFFDAMLAELGDTLCIDEARVYATGLSNGAMMTSLLICARSDVLAAAAPVAGVEGFEECASDAPLPVLAFHGTADPILLFNGGFGGLVDSLIGGEVPDGDAAAAEQELAPFDLDGEGYPAAVRALAERNGCDPEPTTTVTETGEPATPEVIRVVYDCPEGADVEFVAMVGQGHGWPGSEFSVSIERIVGPTTFAVDATADAWAFFQRFAR